MDDDGVRGVLRDYVTTAEPPPRITVATAVAAGRRFRRTRMAIASGAAVAVLVTGGATGLVLDGLTGSWLPGIVGTGGALKTDVCATSAAADDARVARASCYLVSTLPSLLPEARFDEVHGPRDVDALHLFREGDSYVATGVIIDSAGVGTVSFTWERRAPSGSDHRQEMCKPGLVCDYRAGAHGEDIFIYRPVDSGDGVETLTIYVYSGETVITVAVSNQDGRRWIDATWRVTREHPPLTVDQLITLAAAPEMLIF